MAEPAQRVLVVDDDTSRHREVASWIQGLGLAADVRDRPPGEDIETGDLAMVIIHAGYGRLRPGFPRPERRAEAVHWLLDDPSYLFHEDLDAFRALGRRLDGGVLLVAMTGGSGRDIPVDELTRLAGTRRLVCWNVIELVSTESMEEVQEGPADEDPGQADPARVESEVRHDLLNRLWNMALAAGEEEPDAGEITEIIQGDEDQSSLGVLVQAATGLDASTRSTLQAALERAAQGTPGEDLASITRRAIEELEGR